MPEPSSSRFPTQTGLSFLAWKPAPAAEPAPGRPEVRRLSENTLAVRAAPGMRWWVVSSRTPLLAYEVEDLEHAMEQDFSLEVTIQPGA